MYKTSISGPLLICISKAEGQELLSEIHAGVYAVHIGATTLDTKVHGKGSTGPQRLMMQQS
jgi:hypothetical protein